MNEDFESAVEHFFNFGEFYSTFGAARPGFEVSGRQKSHIHPSFCLLSRPRVPNLESPVDKKEAFLPVFVYFRDRSS